MMRDCIPNPCLAAALAYATDPDFPIYVFPCPPGEKKSYYSKKFDPDDRRWGATIDPERIKRYWKEKPEANVCIVTGAINGLFVIETDTKEGHPNLEIDGEVSLKQLIAANGGEWPDTYRVLSPSGSTHYYFAWPDDDNITIPTRSMPNIPGIDTKGDGGMVVAPPSVRSLDDNRRYEQIGSDKIKAAPRWLIKLIAEKQAERHVAEPQADIDKLATAMELIPNLPNTEWGIEGETKSRKEWDGWNDLMMALWRASGGSHAGFIIAEKFSCKNPKYNNERSKAYLRHSWFKRYVKTPPSRLGAGTIFAVANHCAPGWQQKYEQEAITSAFAPIPEVAAPKSDPDPIIPKPDEPKPEAPDSAPLLSEDYLALQFTKAHAETLRYVAPWGKWLIYDGAKWNFDEKLKAFTMARQICRTAAKPINKKKEGKAVASAKTRSAVISLAQSDPVHAASTEQWDVDPWLLNTPNGVIDLRTGRRRDHNAADYMTKICGVTPGRACPIPLWSGFLATVTANDTDLQSYIQRMLGYALTGITIEHALFFLYGMGANGKGVLMNTVARILNDYHKTASQETFTSSPNERHPTDLAMLRGARLVTVSETEQGKRWAESRIKTMTGGDPITARFMRQDFFEYDPQFKLMISGQHRPGLNSVNEAIRRRFHLLPFNVVIPVKQRDKRLTEKLVKEWPGILSWMIEGCLEWQKIGLQPPPIVVAATNAYLAGEDKLSRWIADRCERIQDWQTSSGDLFASWVSWAEENREWVGTQTSFSNALTEAGFEHYRTESTRGFKGLRVLPVEPFSEHGLGRRG
jgi:putative DNA primase/helicase